MLINFYLRPPPFSCSLSLFCLSPGKTCGRGPACQHNWLLHRQGLTAATVSHPVPATPLPPPALTQQAGRQMESPACVFFLGSQRISLLVNVNLSPKACSGSQRGRAPPGCRMDEDSLVASGVTLACVCFPGQEWSGTFQIFSRTRLLKEGLLMILIPALIVSLLDNLSGWHACNASLPEAFHRPVKVQKCWVKDKSKPTFNENPMLFLCTKLSGPHNTLGSITLVPDAQWRGQVHLQVLCCSLAMLRRKEHAWPESLKHTRLCLSEVF